MPLYGYLIVAVMMSVFSLDAMDKFEMFVAAAASGKVKSLQGYLLDEIVSDRINCRDRHGYTALMLAAKNGHLKAVECLIENDANLDEERIWCGETALMFAAHFNHPDIAQILIDAHANLNQKSNKGRSALMCAARNDCSKIAQLLLAAGADVNQKDNDGVTALMHAARCNNPEICHDIVRGYLAQQKERVCTLMKCFIRLYPSQYSNLRNIFRPWLRVMIQEALQLLYSDINQTENNALKGNNALKNQLLAICDSHR